MRWCREKRAMFFSLMETVMKKRMLKEHYSLYHRKYLPRLSYLCACVYHTTQKYLVCMHQFVQWLETTFFTPTASYADKKMATMESLLATRYRYVESVPIIIFKSVWIERMINEQKSCSLLFPRDS